LQLRQRDRQRRLRAEIMQAMLICSGELGYRRVTVERVYKRYGGSRSQFYRHFDNKEACFSAAFAVESERLLQRLLAQAKERTTKAEQLEAALGELSIFISREPALAKALFVEVHVAGGAALELRREISERLSRVLDQTCRGEQGASCPPSATAAFMIGVLEQAVSLALVKGEPEKFDKAIPELVGLVAGVYPGPSPAEG
jgi:AcrR family transcriptional regulator